jgi:phage terminase small subunit
MAGKLTPKQSAFVTEYLKDLNATQAAIRAGYSEKTAYRIGAELLQKTSVAEAVQNAKAKRAQRVAIEADDVLKQFMRFAFCDVRLLYNPDGTLKPMNEWPDDAAAAVNGIDTIELAGDVQGCIKKLKLVDKLGALNSIAKHLGMLSDVHKHVGKDGGPIELDMTVTPAVREIVAKFTGAE